MPGEVTEALCGFELNLYRSLPVFREPDHTYIGQRMVCHLYQHLQWNSNHVSTSLGGYLLHRRPRLRRLDRLRIQTPLDDRGGTGLARALSLSRRGRIEMKEISVKEVPFSRPICWASSSSSSLVLSSSSAMYEVGCVVNPVSIFCIGGTAYPQLHPALGNSWSC